MPDPPIKPDPATVAWGRTTCFLRRLRDALDELEEAGGLEQVARVERWNPAAVDRAVASLGDLRAAIDIQVARAEAARDPDARAGKRR